MIDLINKHKSEYYKEALKHADCKETSRLVRGLFHSGTQQEPHNNDPKNMPNNLAIFFASNIKKICESFDITDSSINDYTTRMNQVISIFNK